MNKLEVGMYVRTKYGYIAKLIDVDYEEEYYEFDKGIVWFYEYLKDTFSFDSEDLKQITKASHNIIDLIEVGDYVNGEQVWLVTNGKLFVGDVEQGYYLEEFEKWEGLKIKTIVTKEQFEAMTYKVGGKNE